MDSGFFKIYRKLTESDLWLSEPFTRGQAWVDLINLAQFRPGIIRVRGVKVIVKRGQVGWSEVKIAARWRWSRGKLRRFLLELSKDERIEQQKNNVTSLITIINYESYQPDRTTDSTTDGQQTDSRQYPKERKKKKEKKVKKEEPPISPKVKKFEKFWTAYPKKIGKGAALKSFEKQNGRMPDIETLISIIEKHKLSTQWTKDGGQYIPNPATWLNQARWDDVLEIETKEESWL